MQRVLRIFDRDDYASQSDGTAQQYFHSDKLCDTLGQADSIAIHVIGDRQSVATARAKILVYHSSRPDVRPREAQQRIPPNLVINSLRPEPFYVYGPFNGRLELVLEVDDSASASDVRFSLEIHATGYYR